VKIRSNPWLVFLTQGRFKLKFQVKDQEYFLAFVEDEGRWYVFSPTPQGLQRIPVYVDAPASGRMVAAREGTHKLSS